MQSGIDKGLLCHSCIMRRCTDGINGRTVAERIQLTNVRIVTHREAACSGDAKREKCGGVCRRMWISSSRDMRRR